jgi:DHA1 family bicyclomycin/chloramphenicol resistance-like MFS transporter
MRFGMRRISHNAVLWFIAMATLNAILVATGKASLWIFLPVLALTLAVFGMVAGNFNALAMEPMGRIAGSAAALFGAVTSVGGAALGGLIARGFDGTPLPFLIGLALVGLATLLTVLWVERGRLATAQNPAV